MKKWILIPIVLVVLVISFYLFNDARTLDIDKSKLPVDEQLGIQVSQRYLAGGWTHPVKLHLTPYAMENVKETSETFVVNIVDESDTSSCKGYQVIVEKNTGKVKSKENINYCN